MSLSCINSVFANLIIGSGTSLYPEEYLLLPCPSHLLKSFRVTYRMISINVSRVKLIRLLELSCEMI